jgi:hypothetical protein
MKILPNYLNMPTPFNLFLKQISSRYYIDKTLMIVDLLDEVNNSAHNSLCVTRPRRFGKSMMAETIAAFFTKGLDSSGVFSKFKISDTEAFSQINSRNLFYIDLNQEVSIVASCDDLIIKLCSGILEDMSEAFPNIKISSTGSYYSEGAKLPGERLMMNPQAMMLLGKVVATLKASKEQFVFVVDEWDSPFEAPYMSEGYKLVYLDFLRTLFKQQDFVYFTYFTGVLPIPSYSNVSALNNFQEFILGQNELFSTYFGFTQDEVSELYDRYLKRCKEIGRTPKVSLRNLKRWYNGYRTPLGLNMYNPLSVVSAFTQNTILDFWAKSGKAQQVLDYLRFNFTGVLGDVASLINDKDIVLTNKSVSLKNLTYGVERPKSRDEVLSMLVAVGLLTYSGKKVSIPNEEVRSEFIKAIEAEKGFGALHDLVVRSQDILDATLAKDTNALAKLLSEVHNEESPMLFYNSEAELTLVIVMAYISAVDEYERKRQNPAGKGYADILFTPIDPAAPAFVVELKVDEKPGVALGQIKERNCHAAFRPKKFTGPVLLVAITYDRKTKTHSCEIEEIARPFLLQ